MANEINVNPIITVTKNGIRTSPSSTSYTADQTGDGVTTDTYSVTTTAAEITLPYTPGHLLCKNLDATNYVDIGPWVSAALHKFIRLGPGQSCLFRATGTFAIGAQANTATCSVRITTVEA